MKIKLTIFIFLTAVWSSNGHLRLLGDILTGAHDRIHSGIQNVAGAVLGGISHGLDFNLAGHVDVNGQRHPENQGGYNSNTRPGDTVVVIIKEEDNNNNYRPPNNNFQRPNGPPFNYGQGPNNQYEQNNQRPNYNIPNRDENYINQHPGRPNYGNNYPYNQNQGNNNFNNYPNNQQHDYNGQTDSGYPNNQNFNRPNYNNDRPDISGNHQVIPTIPFDKTTDIPEAPSTEFITKKPNYTPKEQTTKKTIDDDAPFFVPLKPNEYSYNGDTINITAPKREANNKAETGDEVFDIDIRSSDE